MADDTDKDPRPSRTLDDIDLFSLKASFGLTQSGRGTIADVHFIDDETVTHWGTVEATYYVGDDPIDMTLPIWSDPKMTETFWQFVDAVRDVVNDRARRLASGATDTEAQS